ncbi:MAG: hypothetical protein P1U82_16120, partial [Verrucomicrobiales bacterium]|nr:hypothetical protein [Verrucomicrobiales bacterium]
MNLDETFPEELSQQQVMAMVAAAEARKSKMVALMIAIGAHVVLIGGLLFVVFGEVLERQPNLIISAPYTPLEQLKPAKKDLVQVKAQKPAAPSASMSKVIVAQNVVSAIPMPIVEEFDEDTVNFGTGFGEGMGSGMGGFGGQGRGGSFFGTPAA